jgi:hypothetical protein
MHHFYLILNWIFAVIFGLAGVGLLFSTPLPAISLTILSLFLLPPVRQYFYMKTNKTLSSKTKGWIIVLLLVVFGALVGISEQADVEGENAAKKKQTIDYYYSNKDSILGEIQMVIGTSNYDAALLFIEQRLYINKNTLLSTRGCH